MCHYSNIAALIVISASVSFTNVSADPGQLLGIECRTRATLFANEVSILRDGMRSRRLPDVVDHLFSVVEGNMVGGSFTPRQAAVYASDVNLLLTSAKSFMRGDTTDAFYAFYNLCSNNNANHPVDDASVINVLSGAYGVTLSAGRLDLPLTSKWKQNAEPNASEQPIVTTPKSGWVSIYKDDNGHEESYDADSLQVDKQGQGSVWMKINLSDEDRAGYGKLAEMKGDADGVAKRSKLRYGSKKRLCDVIILS